MARSTGTFYAQSIERSKTMTNKQSIRALVHRWQEEASRQDAAWKEVPPIDAPGLLCYDTPEHQVPLHLSSTYQNWAQRLESWQLKQTGHNVTCQSLAAWAREEAQRNRKMMAWKDQPQALQEARKAMSEAEESIAQQLLACAQEVGAA